MTTETEAPTTEMAALVLPTNQTKPMGLRIFEEVELATIQPNPWQPRRVLGDVAELAENIRTRGLDYVPSFRRLSDGTVQQHMGHRRVAALMLLGHATYELERVEKNDRQMAIDALSENVQRKQLTQMEEFRAWQAMLQIDGMTIADLAATSQKDRSTVSNSLRLLNLPETVLKYVDEGEMSPHGAREFLCFLGSDGHYHEAESAQVLTRLTTGTPDWRVVRIRNVISDVVSGTSTSDWRKLFEGHAGGGHSADPAFDVETFATDNAAATHRIPHDDIESKWTDGAYQIVKLNKEQARPWTCAVSAWVKAQKAGKAAAEGVAGAASKKAPATDSAPKTPGKTSKWPQTLSQDPVFKKVSPETDGPLMKTLTKDERNEQAAAQMGTRGTPGIVPPKGSKTFAGAIDERHEGGWAWNAYEVRKRPGYFADIVECRTLCTTGAQYLQQNDKAPLELFCTNESCWDQHCSKGRKVVEAKVTKAVREVDARDAELYGVLEATATPQPVEVTQLLAAVVLRDIRPGKVDPRTGDWEVDRELAAWPANAAAIATAAGLKSAGEIDREPFDINATNARELLLRAVVERTRGKDMQPFVDQLVKATTAPVLPDGPNDGLSQE